MTVTDLAALVVLTATVPKLSKIGEREICVPVPVERTQGSLHCVQETPQSAILNLEQGDSIPGWGRLIFYVTDVDALWTHLKDRGFDPETPRDAAWGERYFHMPDPDGHELSFARPLR